MRAILAAICLSALVSGPSAAQSNSSRSQDLAKQLVSAMASRHLDAIAAADPAEPGRFIAALAFPDVQLLVVSSRHPSVDYLKQQIAKRLFRDVYGILHEGPDADRTFFLDMGCDGIQTGGENVDVLYQGRSQQTRFDGKWEAQSLSEAEYTLRLTQAEGQYERTLTVLLDAVKRLPVLTDGD
jgi:hypothetical protein